MNINIGTIQINKWPHIIFYSDILRTHVSRISFYDEPNLKFPRDYDFPVGKTVEDAVSTYDFIRSNFDQVNIHSGDRVTILFDDEGNILALGKDKENVWLDVTDQFKVKTFAELNIEITSLKVYFYT